MMDHLELKLCDIQGRLFELSAGEGIPSREFIKAYMLSDTAADMDSSYNRIQWMGEEYVLAEVKDVMGIGGAAASDGKIKIDFGGSQVRDSKAGADKIQVSDAAASYGKIYDGEVLYWIGYIYRYWHYYTGESSAKIYRQASAETMNRNYQAFHSMSPEVAIEDLKEIHAQKKSAASK